MGDFQGHPFRGNQYTQAFTASRERSGYKSDDTFTASDFADHAMMGLDALGLRAQDVDSHFARAPLKPGEVRRVTTDDARALLNAAVKTGDVAIAGVKTRYESTTARNRMAVAMQRKDQVYKIAPAWTPARNVSRETREQVEARIAAREKLAWTPAKPGSALKRIAPHLRMPKGTR